MQLDSGQDHIISYHIISCHVMSYNISKLYIYLRAAAPAADPGRIGKEAKQIGIKTLRCFAP